MKHKYIFTLLVLLAISVGFIESISIALMYPIISSGLGIEIESNEYLKNIVWISDLIPGLSSFEGIIVIFLLTVVFAFFCQIIYWKLAYLFTKTIIVDIKKGIYHQISQNDYRFFEERKQGDIINLLNAGPQAITQSLEIFMAMICDFAIILMILLTLFVISEIGVIIVIFGGMIYYFLNNQIGKTASQQLGQQEYHSGLSENVIISEYISGMRSIRASNAMNHWEDLAIRAISSYWDFYGKRKFIQKMPTLVLYSFFLFSIGIIVLILSRQFQHDFSLIIPVFGAFAIATFRIIPKITNIGSDHLYLINYNTYMEAIQFFLSDNSFHTLKNGSIRFDKIISPIHFDHVSFSYGRNLVLKDLSFIIRPEKVTAIVGSSGAGKSTITSLLLRLYDPSEGKILINGRDLREFDIGSIRDKIGYVGQEPFVFHASIRDNITFGGDFSDEEVKSAAILAHAHHFIMEFPEGYLTQIGDRGIKLSGGEKQRIVIARAMIRNPDILILDEATSSLDNISERMVQEAIDEIAKKCTTFVIAHRLSTIQRADIIYVLDKGEIVEEGTHIELMENRGEYWRMYMKGINNL